MLPSADGGAASGFASSPFVSAAGDGNVGAAVGTIAPPPEKAKIGLSAADISCLGGAKIEVLGIAAGMGSAAGAGAGEGGCKGGAWNAPPADSATSGCLTSLVALLSWLIQMNARAMPDTTDPVPVIPLDATLLLVPLILVRL
jgi:hypothetical protein